MTIRDLIESGKISLDTVVVGELPITADGCLVGVGARLFYQESAAADDVALCWLDRPGGYVWNELMLVSWYSTREAAERAAKEG